MDLSVHHHEEKRHFACTLEEHDCMVEYEMKNPDTMDIYRTFVHDDLRGKGIAEALMKSASEHAMARGISVILSCSYAVQFYKRHPEYASILAPGVDLENGGSCRLPKKAVPRNHA